MRFERLALFAVLLAGCEQIGIRNPVAPNTPAAKPVEPLVGAPSPAGPTAPGPAGAQPSAPAERLPGPAAPGPAAPGPGPADPGPGVPQPGTGPAIVVDDEFQGYHLGVELNGHKTEKLSRAAGEEQRWNVPATSGALTIRFMFEPEHLGALRSVEVVVNPTDEQGRLDRGTILRPVSPPQWIDNASLELGRWHRLASGALATVDALPAGHYVLHFTVYGEKTWDRQSIHLTVE